MGAKKKYRILPQNRLDMWIVVQWPQLLPQFSVAYSWQHAIPMSKKQQEDYFVTELRFPRTLFFFFLRTNPLSFVARANRKRKEEESKNQLPRKSCNVQTAATIKYRHNSTMRWAWYQPLHSKRKHYKHAMCGAVNNAARLQRKARGTWYAMQLFLICAHITLGHSRVFAIYSKFTATCVWWCQPTERNCSWYRVSLMSSSSAHTAVLSILTHYRQYGCNKSPLSKEICLALGKPVSQNTVKKNNCLCTGCIYITFLSIKKSKAIKCKNIKHIFQM